MLADLLAFAVPMIVLLALARHTGAAPPGGRIGEMASQFADPAIALPAAFVVLLLQQGLRFWAAVLARQIDRLFFASESHAIYERYKAIPLYLEDLSDKMRPMWFSKNIARNVRHTSEAMQGLLNMVPQLITMGVSIVALALISPVAAGVLLPIGALAALALMPPSRRIFEHSRQHFEERLTEFAKDLSVQLNRVYREPSGTDLAETLPPSFGMFLDSRFRLHMLRARYSASSAIVFGALFLTVIGAAVLFSGNSAGAALGLAELGLVVVLLILLMNKAAGLVGGIGGILTLYPQIKMSREIEANLELSRQAWAARGPREDSELWRRLPFLTKVQTTGQFTRFNLMKLLELIEARIGAEGRTLPMEELVFVRNSSLERHLDGVELDADRPHRVLYMLKRLRKTGKRIVIIDWATLNEMTLANIEGLARNYRNLRIIVPTTASLPRKWKESLGDQFDVIESFAVVEDAGDQDLQDSFADD